MLVNAAPAQRADLILGNTWKACPFNIAFISLPLFAATLWALKGLAPTRLALAGASAGLLAGALSSLVYALHCPESAAPFLGSGTFWESRFRRWPERCRGRACCGGSHAWRDG